MLHACEYYKLQQAHFHFQDLNVHLTWNMALNFSAIILIKGQLYLRVYMAFCDARSVIRYIMIQLLVEGHHCHESCLIRYPTHIRCSNVHAYGVKPSDQQKWQPRTSALRIS